MTWYLDPCQNLTYLLRVKCEMRKVIWLSPSTKWGESCPSLCVYCSYSKPVWKTPAAKSEHCWALLPYLRVLSFALRHYFSCIPFMAFVPHINICFFQERKHCFTFHNAFFSSRFFSDVVSLNFYFENSKTSVNHMPLQVLTYVRICLRQSVAGLAMILLPRCIFSPGWENLKTDV